MGPLGTNSGKILIRIQNIFIRESESENIVCEMDAIFPEGDESRAGMCVHIA